MTRKGFEEMKLSPWSALGRVSLLVNVRNLPLVWHTRHLVLLAELDPRDCTGRFEIL